MQRMPGSTGGIVVPTFKHGQTNTLPSLLAVWKRWGYINGLHYVVGRKPPKSFARPIIELNDYEHVISFYNCCAHHSRVWNRRYMVSVALPYNTLFPFMDRTTIGQIRTNKLFAVLSCIAYILDIISPGSDFKKNIKELLKSDCRLLDLKDMGFPKYW